MKTRRVVLDSNFIFRLLREAGTGHRQALKLFQKLSADTVFVVPVFVQLEAIIADKLMPGYFAEVEELLEETTTELCHSDDDLLLVSRFLVTQLKFRLKPFDLGILATAFKHKATLFTFDSKLVAAAHSLGIKTC